MNELLLLFWVLATCYILLFLLSIKLQDNSIADVFWGIGFVILAFASYFLYSVGYTSQTIMTLLVWAWGIRLFFNIFSKKLPYSGKEDARYKIWRDTWKYFYTRSFFQVYVLQWCLMCLVAIPILVLNLSSGFEERLFVTFLGANIAFFGLLYEARADAELAGFIVNKKSWEILTTWLRKFHRYPQYFGESVFWLWISIIASQISMLAFGGWIVITILVRYVSGVPMLEKRYEWQKNFEIYSKNTPIFFPDFSKIQFKK